LLILSGEQPAFEASREYSVLEPVLPVVHCIIAKHAANSSWLTNDDELGSYKARYDRRLFKMRKRPSFERIVEDCTQQRQKAEGLRAGDRGRRAPSGGARESLGIHDSNLD
jgi:hypothetical protein